MFKLFVLSAFLLGMGYLLNYFVNQIDSLRKKQLGKRKLIQKNKKMFADVEEFYKDTEKQKSKKQNIICKNPNLANLWR